MMKSVKMFGWIFAFQLFCTLLADERVLWKLHHIQ
jgi:hypothetical protein